MSRVLRVRRARPAPPVRRAPPVLRACPAPTVRLVRPAPPVATVPAARLVLTVPPALPVHLVRQALLGLQVHLAHTERTASKPRRACVWSFCTDSCKRSRKIARTIVCAEVGLGGHVCVAHSGVFSYFRVVIERVGGTGDTTRSKSRAKATGPNPMVAQASCERIFCSRLLFLLLVPGM